MWGDWEVFHKTKFWTNVRHTSCIQNSRAVNVYLQRFHLSQNVDAHWGTLLNLVRVRLQDPTDALNHQLSSIKGGVLVISEVTSALQEMKSSPLLHEDQVFLAPAPEPCENWHCKQTCLGLMGLGFVLFSTGN